MARRDREEEKMKLWNEVLGKDRVRKRNSNDAEISLTTGVDEPSSSVTLKKADEAMKELNAILEKQKKDLEKMKEEAEKKEKLIGVEPELVQLEKEIQKDYGDEIHLKEEKQNEPVDSRAVFDKVNSAVKEKIVGQDEGVNALCSALRRPFVMGREKGRAENAILVMGPEGSGRHAAISAAARSLYEQHIFYSDEVYTIDLSRYTSSAQEQIFLQDMYQALKGKGGIVCFENFEEGFAPFLRMVSSLVTEGRIVLSKRYVLNRGVLVENQTGLVKNSIGSFEADGKYLLFITSGKISDVQDAFGATFMYHILDTVVFNTLDEEAIRVIIEQQVRELQKKCTERLHVSLSIEPSIHTWILAHYDKTAGADAVLAYFHDFYISLSEVVLKQDVKEIRISVQDDVPTACYEGGTAVLIRERNAKKEIEEVDAELDNIIGLKEVKTYIHSLKAHVAIQERRKQQGMKTAEISRHMIFTGNPGTGKTTIARLFARYMKAIGALSQGQLVEVTRADLVARYVGQTAPLTMSVIRSAIGGVLFIDEAYSLYRGKDDSFGLEAIDTLVKAMEDNRDDLIVILAGYSREMKEFLEANSGLKSRFANIIEFPDYSAEELLQIAQLQAKGKGYRIHEEALEPLRQYFETEQRTNAAKAGNGRLARNVVEEAILRQSRRLMEEVDAPLDELQPSDFDIPLGKEM